MGTRLDAVREIQKAQGIINTKAVEMSFLSVSLVLFTVIDVVRRQLGLIRQNILRD
jgi:hypothetical protein